MAPEMLTGPNLQYGFEIDVWSLGIIMFYLVFGYLPFNASTEWETYESIKKLEFDFPKEIEASAEVKDLITLILFKNPQKRPTFDRILKHKFFHKN